MKKLKFIAMLVASLFISMNFVSCSDDDDEEGSNIALVGNWGVTEEGSNSEHVAFYANGTGKVWEVNRDGEEEDVENFTWTAEGNKVTMTFTYGEKVETIDTYWKVEGGKLYISEDADFEDCDVYDKTKKPSNNGNNGGTSNDMDKLVGSWVSEEDIEMMYITLNGDGTGNSYSTYYGQKEDKQDFTWSISGNKMTFYNKGGEKETGYWKIEGGKLYMSESSSFSGDVIVYSKK